MARVSYRRLRYAAECDACGAEMVESQVVLRCNKELYCSEYCFAIEGETADTMFDAMAQGRDWRETAST